MKHAGLLIAVLQIAMTISSEDFSTIPDGAWTLVEIEPHFRRYACQIDDTRTVYKTEFLGNDELIQSNQDELFESQTKRFGDMTKVASIPLNVLYDPKTQIMEKLKQGDKDHMKWWLNRGDNRMWRTFRGRI